MTTICIVLCRMQSYASQQLGDNIIFLSPMHITQRAITGHDVSDTHPRLVNLTPLQQVEVRVKMRGEIMYRKGQYILSAMKKVEDDGCILAVHVGAP